MRVIVLMVLQMCCKCILTCTFHRHQEGVHFCPCSCCFFSFVQRVKWVCLFTPVMLFTLWICKTSSFCLLVAIASVSVPLILCYGFQKWEEAGKQIIWTVGKAKVATSSHAFLQEWCWLCVPLRPCWLNGVFVWSYVAELPH